MATYTVTSLANSGAGSLREAMSLALSNGQNTMDAIVFAAGLSGGTLTLTSELLIFTDVTIDGDTNGDNKADITISGGGTTRILKVVDVADVALKSLTLTNGRATQAGGGDDGGAIYMNGVSLDIQDTTIQNSFATYGGGGIHVQAGSVRIANSLLVNNTAESYGGGVRVFGGDVTMVNTTLSGNTTKGTGGGIVAQDGTLTLHNSTLTLNRADTDGASTTGGGGLFFSGGAVTVTNTVIAGNSSGGSAAPGADLGGLALGVANSFVNGDAGLGALADNGGTVRTHAPLAGSVLLGGGNSALLPADFLDIDGDGNKAEALPRDGRGLIRVNGTLDIGAVEGPGLMVTTAADVVNANDGLLSLREAVAIANGNANADSITFAANLAGSTIVLTGELALTNDVTINGDTNGDNKADITISGNNAVRILHITGAATDVDVLSLTLANGNANFGGAIYAHGHNSLDIVDTTIRNSTAQLGGGIESDYGTTRIVNSLVTGNNATGAGGAGIYNFYGTMQLVNTTVHGNSTTGFGGGLRNTGTLSILDSTVTANVASAGGADAAAGGGIDVLLGTITIANSAVADNLSGSGAVEHDVRGTVATATNSVFGTAVPITTNNGSTTGVAHVGLSSLLDNGGTVLTRSPLDGSVLIGAGSITAIPASRSAAGRRCGRRR